jgi:hypothetical protein
MVAEEVFLYRRGKMVGQRVETVCQFQRQQDLVASVQVSDEQPEPLVTDSYDIDATIDPNYKFSARATLRLIGRRDQQRWAPLYLYSELDVDSVTSKGQPHCCQPSHRVLFDERRDLIADCAKTLNEGFGFCIAGDRHRKIRVAGKPRLGPNGHSQTADQSEVDTRSCEICRNPMQR